MDESHIDRSWPETVSLDVVLKAGAVISGSTSSESKTANPNGLADVLRSRLEQFDAIIDGISRTRPLDLQTLQLGTAYASLYVAERVHALLLEHDVQNGEDSTGPLPIGSKDMVQIRTHLSVVFNWGTDLLTSRIIPSLPSKSTRLPRVPPGAQIIDLTATHEDYLHLLDVTSRILKIIFPEGPQGSSSTTFVSMTILNRGFADLLGSCIFLAWLPNDVQGDASPDLDIKAYISPLLNGSPPAQSITALGTVVRKMQKPLYVRKICKLLSTEQLLRPAGVSGLLSSVFGEDVASTEAPLEKLQSTSNVLNTLPPHMSPEEYYPLIIPRLLQLLSPSMDKTTPPSHRRAASFALSRVLDTNNDADGQQKEDIRRKIVSWCLLDSFKVVPRPASDTAIVSEPASAKLTDVETTDGTGRARSIAANALVLPPSQAIPSLSTILLNTDPSPELIDALLTPIAPQLYTLLEDLLTSKTADPVMHETVEGLLGIWARTAGKDEIVGALWDVVEGQGGEWGIDDAGELHVFQRATSLPSLTLTQLADLQEGKLDSEEDDAANPLGLHPHPLYFAKFIKSIKREDIASALYLRILDVHVKLEDSEDPLRKLLLFKLSMQISSQVGSDVAADSPLRRPDVTRMLMFIKMSLDRDDTLRGSENKGSGQGKLSRDSLRFVSDEDESDGADEDSDDEDLAPGLEGVSRREHLSVTAVNLLLALLQEHPDLSPKSEPLLNEIYSQLEPLANSSSDALRPRAREARITLTARLASSSSAAKPRDSGKKNGEEESPQEKYQRALKLLQDPLLPVRAHGLLLLRELVAPAKAMPVRRGDKDKPGGATGVTVSIVQGADVRAPSVDAALVPAILSIFMQSIQDEDSYIFLNAVQGLAAMVDGFGREVLKGLIDEYSKGLEGIGGSVATMTSREVDLRVRVGEALGQVIRRCGDALGKYVDIIVPRIFAVVRAAHLPTTLRTSAVSLLATAADTNTHALSAYAADIITAMVDLVQVESVRATAPAPPGQKEEKAAESAHSPDIAEANSDSLEAPDGRDETRLGDVEEGTRSQPRPKVSPEPGTVKDRNATRLAARKGSKTEVDNDIVTQNTMDARPTASNPKFPPLRRAALHFLSLLLRSQTTRVYNDAGQAFGRGIVIPPAPEMKRAETVLGYVSMTDEDGVVRVMAREALELLQQLRNALLGL